MHKYRNTICITPDGRFDSKAERSRWFELKVLERAGDITHLRRQVPYECRVNGLLICRYIADFVYTDRAGALVVEDVKGVLTREFRIKQKLMRALHNINIQIIQ